MARLSRQWREILENIEFHRDSQALRGAEELPDEATMRPIIERLAAKWEDRVHASVPAGPLFQFGRKATVAPGDVVLCVRRFEKGRFVIVLEAKPAEADADWRTIQIELCSPPHLFAVLDVLLHDLEGSGGQRPLPEGWDTIRLAGGGLGKFWAESERSWQDAPVVEGLAVLPLALREDRAWRLLGRWVPGALALFPCPCIQDLGQVFQGPTTCQDAAWPSQIEATRVAAVARCTNVNQVCISLQVWVVTGIAPVAPSTLLNTTSSLLAGIPDWVEVRRGAEAARPIRLTFEALTKATFHDVVGNPYRPVYPEPAWLSANDHAVEHLARQIDEVGEYNRLGLLGDALQDAGCDHPAVLDHCREDGFHGPGCWVIDTLLGRLFTRG